MTYLPDTSCIVALLCSWHEHHVATLREMNQRAKNGDRMLLAAHSVVETYAVLTRLPFPYRLSEQDALRLLEENFSQAPVIALSSVQYWRVIQECNEKKISGGQAYDALIVASAKKGKATVLLTWNLDHFTPFQDAELSIKSPVDKR